MTKVQILTTCDHYNGQAYVPVGEAEDHNGHKYLRHAPCSMCEGSGQCPKWVSLEDFAMLLRQECSPGMPQGVFPAQGQFIADQQPVAPLEQLPQPYPHS